MQNEKPPLFHVKQRRLQIVKKRLPTNEIVGAIIDRPPKIWDFRIV